MNIYTTFLFAAGISLCSNTSLQAQADYKHFPAELENVRIATTDSVCYVQYTNNAWRNEANALYAVLESMLSIAPRQAWHISVAIDGVPQITIQAHKAQVEAAVLSQQISDQFTESLQISYQPIDPSVFRNTPIHNRAIGKTDLVLYPQFKFENNTFERIWETQFNLAPAIETTLWNGAHLTAQVIFPIHNNINSAEARFIRPGILALSQHYRLPHSIFGSVSVGNFTANRMGIAISNYWTSTSGIYQIGYTASLTGTSYVDRRGWSLSRWKRLSAHLKCIITPHFYNLDAEITAGRYIYGDYGAQVTLTRRFSNAALQLFGRYSGSVSCAGVGITFPLWLRKQSRAKLFRAKVSDWYDLSYSERSGSNATQGAGRTFTTSPSATPMTHYLNPYYIKDQLIRLAQKKSRK